jgi:hypothetical protein
MEHRYIYFSIIFCAIEFGNISYLYFSFPLFLILPISWSQSFEFCMQIDRSYNYKYLMKYFLMVTNVGMVMAGRFKLYRTT